MAGPIHKLFKSRVHYALTWILRILGPIKFCKGPIKISNGPLKFGNLHVFEWDMGHWSILRAHHLFGLGLSLGLSIFCSVAETKDFVEDLFEVVTNKSYIKEVETKQVPLPDTTAPLIELLFYCRNQRLCGGLV